MSTKKTVPARAREPRKAMAVPPRKPLAPSVRRRRRHPSLNDGEERLDRASRAFCVRLGGWNSDGAVDFQMVPLVG